MAIKNWQLVGLTNYQISQVSSKKFPKDTWASFYKNSIRVPNLNTNDMIIFSASLRVKYASYNSIGSMFRLKMTFGTATVHSDIFTETGGDNNKETSIVDMNGYIIVDIPDKRTTPKLELQVMSIDGEAMTIEGISSRQISFYFYKKFNNLPVIKGEKGDKGDPANATSVSSVRAWQDMTETVLTLLRQKIF